MTAHYLLKSVYPVQQGDTVRSYDNDDRVDWLWLDPTDYPNAAPFTAHTYDYYVVNSAEPPRWPNR